MKVTHVLNKLPLTLFWVAIIFLSLLLSHNAILYFTHGGEYGILPEKLVARQDILWNICFYIHLPTGILCLLSPILLFSRMYVKSSIRMHQLVGRSYVWITLLFVCPTGMYLALYAKGGVVTQIGFMVQGLLLAYFTYMGYEAITQGKKALHREYMIRSYAVAAVVLTFRMLHILFFLWKVPYHDNYAISQWLGLTANLLVAEALIVFMQQRKQSSTKIQII